MKIRHSFLVIFFALSFLLLPLIIFSCISRKVDIKEVDIYVKSSDGGQSSSEESSSEEPLEPVIGTVLEIEPDGVTGYAKMIYLRIPVYKGLERRMVGTIYKTGAYIAEFKITYLDYQDNYAEGIIITRTMIDTDNENYTDYSVSIEVDRSTREYK